MRHLHNLAPFALALGFCLLLCISFTWSYQHVRQLIGNPLTSSSRAVSTAQLIGGYEMALVNASNRLVLADIESGATKETSLEPDGYAWAPDMSALAVVSRGASDVWLVNTQDGTTRILVSPDYVLAQSLSWSPSGRYLAFWGTSGETLALQIFDLQASALHAIPGTDVYNCELRPAAWSFDDRWLLVSAGICNEGRGGGIATSHIVSIPREGGPAGVLANMAYTAAYPSPANHLVAFQSYGSLTGSTELYVADFSSLRASLLQIRDLAGGREWWSPRWLPDGSAFYATPFQWPFPEIDLIDPTTGELQVVWTEEAGTWSPDNIRLATIDGGIIRLFSVTTGDVQDWRPSPSHLCGLHWRDQGELAAAITCEGLGELPVFETSVIRRDGRIIRLGNELFRAILWSNSTVVAVEGQPGSARSADIQPQLDPTRCDDQASPLRTDFGETLAESPHWLIYDAEGKGVFALPVQDRNERVLTSGFLEAYLPSSSPSPWSPDGTKFAFVGTHDTGRALYVAYLDPMRTVNLFSIPEGQHLSELAWSPSGRRLAVVLGEWDLEYVYVIDVEGMAVSQIEGEYRDVQDVSWSPRERFLGIVDSDEQLAFIARDEEGYAILLRHAANGALSTVARATTPITNLEWSPDGRSIVYITCDTRGSRDSCTASFLTIETGAVSTRQFSGRVVSLSWASNRQSLVIALAEGDELSLYLLTSRWPFTTLPSGQLEEIGVFAEGSMSGVSWSPYGDRVAFVVNTTLTDIPQGWADLRFDIYTYELESRRLWNITCSLVNSWARGISWAPNGRFIAFMDGYGVTVAAYDGSGLERVTLNRGDPYWFPATSSFEEAISDSVAISPPQSPQTTLPTPRPTPTSVFGLVSGDYEGIVAYVTHGGYETWALDLATGQRIPLQLEQPERYCCYQRLIGWSPAGDSLALTSWDTTTGEEALLIAERADLIAHSIGTFPVQINDGSSWSPDGRLIAFGAGDPGSSVVRGVYAFDIDARSIRLLADLSTYYSPISWSPDSRGVVFAAEDPENYRYHYVYLARADGGGVVQLTDDPTDRDPAWSPDGEVIAFTRFGLFDTLHTMNPDGSDPRPYRGGSLHVYPDGTRGEHPRWSEDGRFLAYSHLFGAEGGAWAWELATIEYDTGVSSTYRAPGTSRDYYLTSFDWLPGSHLILSTWGGSDLWITDTSSGNSYFIAPDVMGYSATFGSR